MTLRVLPLRAVTGSLRPVILSRRRRIRSPVPVGKRYKQHARPDRPGGRLFAAQAGRALLAPTAVTGSLRPGRAADTHEGHRWPPLRSGTPLPIPFIMHYALCIMHSPVPPTLNGRMAECRPYGGLLLPIPFIMHYALCIMHSPVPPTLNGRTAECRPYGGLRHELPVAGEKRCNKRRLAV